MFKIYQDGMLAFACERLDTAVYTANELLDNYDTNVVSIGDDSGIVAEVLAQSGLRFELA